MYHTDVYLPERIRKRTHCKNDMQVLLCSLHKESKQLWTTPVCLHRFVELFFQARKIKICYQNEFKDGIINETIVSSIS